MAPARLNPRFIEALEKRMHMPPTCIHLPNVVAVLIGRLAGVWGEIEFQFIKEFEGSIRDLNSISIWITAVFKNTL
jgi:hypothetical protein